MQVSSNINQLLLSKGELKDAEKRIDQMIVELENRKETGKGVEKTAQLMSFAIMNRGILEYERSNYVMSADHFIEVLLGFPKLQPGVAQCCLGYLRKITGIHAGKVQIPTSLIPLLQKPARLFQFVLDISGSMGGDPIAECRASIINIVETQLEDNDYCALTVFSATIQHVLPITQKRGNVAQIKNIVQNRTSPESETAFYDAMCDAFQKYDTKHDNKMDTWIIALTDGDDNASYDKTGKRATDLAKTTLANCICIMVGNLKNADVINRICQACPKKGVPIQVGRDDIRSGFDRAVSFVGNVNLEEL
jgi:uncharacterized protein YegL